MAKISDHYDIHGAVPWIDIDVATDNRMFVDPHAIRLQHSPRPFVDSANRATATFFEAITHCALSRSANERRRGLDLLTHFEEPWETRLGLAKHGFQGHGGADDVGAWIWEALTTDMEALVRIGALRQVEDLPLFVEGIDRDITSDVTTRIVFEALADFTQAMVDEFPEFTDGSHRTGNFIRQVWDSENAAWTRKEVWLPIADGRPLVLVPLGWARPTLLMSAGRYYETSVLSYAQLEQAVLSPDGKLLKTPKDQLKKQDRLARGRTTNLRVTIEAMNNEEDLLAAFRTFISTRLTKERREAA